jgi:hypothetical protein
MKKQWMAALLAIASFGVNAEESRNVAENDPMAVEENVDRIPKIHGVFRGRYEGSWPDYEQRFQVRNARVSVEGKVLKDLDYYFRIDLCDRGTMKFLDGWARWKFADNFAVKAGRYRVPFGVDCFRGPGSYLFANRSFMGKETANLRQVGVQLGYYGKKVPLTVEAGVFNSSTKSQENWQAGLDYAAKASYRIQNVTLSAGFLSMDPYGVRMNYLDGSVSWKYKTLIVEGEYQHINYVGNDYQAANSWLAFASYGIPVKWHPFNLWSFHGRFDSLTDFSNGNPDENGVLSTDDAARKRVTVGTSLSSIVKNVKAEIILDYEHYFYDNGVAVPDGGANRIVAELVLKF